MDKMCTIVIPHHDRHDHLKTLLNCLDNTLFDIIIVSGGSFADNCNKGAKLAETERIIFMNDDTTPSNDDVRQICHVLNYVDIVGSTQITKNNKKYLGIGFEINTAVTPNKYYPMIELTPNRALIPSGFLFGVNKCTWSELGGFDTRFKTGYEDVDFGIRCIDNNISMCILDLEIFHHESESSGRFAYNDENAELLDELYDQNKLKKLYENINYCI